MKLTFSALVQHLRVPPTALLPLQKGLKLVALKMVTPSRAHMETHYADLRNKAFFPGLID